MFVPSDFQSIGLGSGALRQVEDEARIRGRCQAFVYALSFQAPESMRSADIQCLAEYHVFPKAPLAFS